MKLNNTTQRKIIFEELKKLKTHPTADELYTLVKKRLPTISLGTVYRNLDLLAETGKILKLELSGKKKRFDGNTSNHFHLRCAKCGNIKDINDDEMSEIDEKLNQLAEKLKVDGYRLELSGLCDSCKK
jgi:Fur family ferric uptake transcriptional regulator